MRSSVQRRTLSSFDSRSRRLVGVLASLCLVVTCAATAVMASVSPASAVNTTTIVGSGSLAPNGPWQLEPTSNTGTYGFVAGPATPPIGVGSLSMSIATGQHEWL